MTVVIAGTFQIAPEDRDAFLTAAKAMMADTHKEEGCQAYNFSPDINDPGVIHLFEKWDNEAVLGPHMKADHMRTFGRAIKELKITGRTITMYEVASEKNM